MVDLIDVVDIEGTEVENFHFVVKVGGQGIPGNEVVGENRCKK